MRNLILLLSVSLLSTGCLFRESLCGKLPAVELDAIEGSFASADGKTQLAVIKMAKAKYRYTYTNEQGLTRKGEFRTCQVPTSPRARFVAEQYDSQSKFYIVGEIAGFNAKYLDAGLPAFDKAAIDKAGYGSRLTKSGANSIFDNKAIAPGVAFALAPNASVTHFLRK